MHAPGQLRRARTVGRKLAAPGRRGPFAVNGYLARRPIGESPLVGRHAAEKVRHDAAVDAFILEKALYELALRAANHGFAFTGPDWLAAFRLAGIVMKLANRLHG